MQPFALPCVSDEPLFLAMRRTCFIFLPGRHDGRRCCCCCQERRTFFCRSPLLLHDLLRFLDEKCRYETFPVRYRLRNTLRARVQVSPRRLRSRARACREGQHPSLRFNHLLQLFQRGPLPFDCAPELADLRPTRPQRQCAGVYTRDAASATRPAACVARRRITSGVLKAVRIACSERSELRLLAPAAPGSGVCSPALCKKVKLHGHQHLASTKSVHVQPLHRTPAVKRTYQQHALHAPLHPAHKPRQLPKGGNFGKTRRYESKKGCNSRAMGWLRRQTSSCCGDSCQSAPAAIMWRRLASRCIFRLLPAPAPAAMLSSRNSNVSRVFCEFLEVAVHQILFARAVYPAELFERKR